MARTIAIVCGLLVAVAVVVIMVRRSGPSRGSSALKVVPAKDEEKLISIVLLLREPRTLTEDQLRVAAARAFGGRFGNDANRGGNFVRQVRANMFPVGVGDAKLGVITSPDRYEARQAFLAPTDVADANARKRAEEGFATHQGWVSVDWFGENPKPEDGPRIYEMLGKLAAELADENCIAVHATESRRLIACDDGVRKRLRADARSMLGPDRLILVDDQDKEMAAAVAEAKRRWPEFVAAWKNRTPQGRFDVKASFADTPGGEAELMWVGVQSVDGDAIRGILKNQPRNLKKIKSGDTVTIQSAEVVDFAITDRGQSIGGFTDRVLLERMNRRRR
jgi:uncharacterized protein YegJ (DUF2314 family)